MRRHAATAAVLATVLAGMALIAALLMPSPAGAAAEPDTQPAAAAPADAFLAALAPATDLPADTAAALLEAADRVCEGVTADVPVMVMADTLAAELSLTDEEARHLVNTAATVHCAPQTV